MMNHHHTLCLGLATLLVVPAIGNRGQDDLNLVARLGRTVQALKELAGIQEVLTSGDRAGVDNILAATEKGTLEPQQRDEYLARLRNDVSLLRMTYDTAVAADPSQAAQHLPSPTAGRYTGMIPVAGAGLDPGTRLALGGVGGPLGRASSPGRQSLTRNSTPSSAQRRSLESDPEFTADAVRQGRLLVRARRYSEAATILRAYPSDVGARYWLGRATAELGYLAEATELLRSVAADPDAGSFASRAELDLRFLIVRRDLERRGDSKAPK